MIELRWLLIHEGRQRLQYRELLTYMNASGSLNVVTGKWGEWKDVPLIEQEEE